MRLVERQHGRAYLILGEVIEYKAGKKRFTERLESLVRLARTNVIRKIVVPLMVMLLDVWLLRKIHLY